MAQEGYAKVLSKGRTEEWNYQVTDSKDGRWWLRLELKEKEVGKEFLRKEENTMKKKKNPTELLRWSYVIFGHLKTKRVNIGNI